MGKDSVITFKISAISVAGGVEGVSSVASVVFSSRVSAFLFFETATFGSGVDFIFFEAFSSSFTILAACLLKMLTILFLLSLRHPAKTKVEPGNGRLEI